MADIVNKIILKKPLEDETSGKEYFYPKTSIDQIDEMNVSTTPSDNSILQFNTTDNKWKDLTLLKSLIFSEKIQSLGTISTNTTVNADNGSVATMTIGASLTITPSATNSGTTLTLIISSGSSYTVSWPSTILWADGAAPTLTAKDMITLFYDGSVWYGVSATGLATA